MKRVFSAIVAVLILLVSAGAFSAGAAEGDVKFDITYTCSLSSSAVPYNDIKQAIPSLASLSELYKSCKLIVKVGSTTKEIPLAYKDGEGYADINVAIPSDTESVDISIKLVSPNNSSTVIFTEPTQTVEYKKGDTSASVHTELNWTDAVLSLRDDSRFVAIIDRLYDKLMEQNGSDWGNAIVDKLINVVKHSLSKTSISLQMLFADDLFNSPQVNDIINKIYTYVYPTAFLLMCVIWLFSVGKSSVSTDLWNKDGYIKPLVRLLWGIGIMSLSMPLLELIFNIFHRMATVTAVYTGIGVVGEGSFLLAILSEARYWVDESWIIGGIMTVINISINIAKLAPGFITNVLFALIFYIIVAIRFLKLATLQCISPFFFACAGSEKADRYLHSFLKEYIIYSAQMFIAIIIYSLLSIMYAVMPVGADGISLILSVLIYIAGIICVCGSAKFLRNLFQ